MSEIVNRESLETFMFRELAGKRAVFFQLFGQFRELILGEFAPLCQPVREIQRSTLRALAHNLWPSCKSLGADALAERILVIETSADSSLVNLDYLLETRILATETLREIGEVAESLYRIHAGKA